MKQYKLSELADIIGAEVVGDENILVSSIGTLATAQPGQISFLSNSKYRSQLSDTQASAVVLQAKELEFCSGAALTMDDPYVGFARIAQLLDTTPPSAIDIAPSSVIAPDVRLGENVSVGANAVIESGAVINDNVEVGPGCFIGKNVRVGQGTRLWANVSIYHETVIGKECLVQSGTVIGSDGFGYANDKGTWLKIPQLGRVVIGDKVEIGANTTIDRGALEDTIIGDGVILDNQCQIAHNVTIGDNTAIAGCSVVAGSTNIGKHCTIGGAVAINGHIDIVDKVYITGFSMVTKSIKEAGVISSGMPASTNKEWRKTVVGLRNLGNLTQRVKSLEKKLAE